MEAQHGGAVLVVEDDALLRAAVRGALLDERWHVTAMTIGEATAVAPPTAEVEVVGVGSACDRALTHCRWLRAQGSPVALLAICADPGLETVVASFNAGFDDVLRRPYDPRELLARVRALLWRRLRRTGAERPGRIHAVGLSLDLAELTLRLPSGSLAHLTPQEARVLNCLAVNAGRVVARQQIEEAGWGPNGPPGESNEVDVYIRRLRRKLGGNAASPAIETAYGQGYRLVAREHAPSQTAVGRLRRRSVPMGEAAH